MKKIKLILKICLFCMLLFIIINFSGHIYALLTPKIDIKSANNFYLYDRKGKLVAQGNDSWINIEDMNNIIINATVATEDKRFFSHNGFDFIRIGQAIVKNLAEGNIVQGASTITQQYARNLFLNFDKTWKRKFKEMALAFKLETHYEKDDILEGYLNTINYGHGVYGIGNASKYYFNKDLNDLDLAEISILIGIPNSPSNYSPISNYKLAKKRQKVVLGRMVNNKIITKNEMNDAYKEELTFYGKFENYNLSSLMYYYDAVMNELESIKSIPKSYLETGGLKIYTSLDIDAQSYLEDSVKYNLGDKDVQTAKVMMNPNNGEIIGLIGGSNYNKSSFNRAINSVRQPGSTIKPFLYYRALERGFTPSTTFLSKKTSFSFDNGSIYSPHNVSNIYGNKDISMVAALAYSDNIYAVKTHLFLGEDELVDILKKVGFTTKLEALPSLPLGCYEVNIIELVKAYSLLANGGKDITSHFINKVMDNKGNVLYQFKQKNDNFLLDSDLTFILSEMLTSTYDNNLIDFTYPTCINMIPDLTHKFAIKTGSTDNDAWIIGYNPNIVLASWTGYDKDKPINNKMVAGNKKSWSYAVEKYLKNKKNIWYKMPNNVVGVLIDPISGEIANKDSKNKKIVYYIKGTEPKNNLEMEVFNKNE